MTSSSKYCHHLIQNVNRELLKKQEQKKLKLFKNIYQFFYQFPINFTVIICSSCVTDYLYSALHSSLLKSLEIWKQLSVVTQLDI